MDKMILYLKKIFAFLIVLVLFSSCAQKGCPGGMCPPDRYNGFEKKISIFSRTNKARHHNFGRSSRGEFRRNNYKSKNTNSNIEGSVFKGKVTKKPNNRRLHRAKKYKVPKRGRTESGLWAPKMRNWQAKRKSKEKKKGYKDTSKKKGHGVKKLD